MSQNFHFPNLEEIFRLPILIEKISQLRGIVFVEGYPRSKLERRHKWRHAKRYALWRQIWN